jgi:hypothetical protein
VQGALRIEKVEGQTRNIAMIKAAMPPDRDG